MSRSDTKPRVKMHLLKVGDTVEPPPKNCSCHISPPCSDCVDYGSLREAIELSKTSLKERQVNNDTDEICRDINRIIGATPCRLHAVWNEDTGEVRFFKYAFQAENTCRENPKWERFEEADLGEDEL